MTEAAALVGFGTERKSNCQWKMTGNPRHRACQNPPQSFSAFASAALIPSWTSVWLLHTWCVSPVYFREQKKRLTVLLSFLGWWFFGFHVHSSLHRVAQVLSPLSSCNWWAVLSQQMSFHSAHILVKRDLAARWVCSIFLFQGGWWVKKECVRCVLFITATLKVMELLYS